MYSFTERSYIHDESAAVKTWSLCFNVKLHRADDLSIFFLKFSCNLDSRCKTKQCSMDWIYHGGGCTAGANKRWVFTGTTAHSSWLEWHETLQKQKSRLSSTWCDSGTAKNTKKFLKKLHMPHLTSLVNVKRFYLFISAYLRQFIDMLRMICLLLQ